MTRHVGIQTDVTHLYNGASSAVVESEHCLLRCQQTKNDVTANWLEKIRCVGEQEKKKAKEVLTQLTSKKPERGDEQVDECVLDC